jgi:potassium/hydrogen antiporter
MVDFILLILGVIILIGFVCDLLFKFTKIPEALFLIIVGILLGPVFGVVDPALAMEYASIIIALMMIVVMLDNGLDFNIFNVIRSVKITVMFTIGVMVLTAVSITAVVYFLLHLSIPEAALIGIMICGDSTDVVTVIVSKMNFNRQAKQLLIMDSVINDLQIIPFFILLGFIETASISGGAIFWSIFIQVPFAILVGVFIAFVWVSIIGKFLGKHPLNYIATLAILFIMYNFMQMLGSSGAITILSFSLVLGNAVGLFKKYHIKRSLRKKFTPAVIRQFAEIEVDVSFLVRTLFFVFLGVIFSFRALEARTLLVSFAILVVIVLSRYAMVRFISRKSPVYKSSTGPLTWILPRGYVAAVLAFAAFGSGMFSSQVMDIVLLNIFITTFVAIAYSIYYGKRKSA